MQATIRTTTGHTDREAFLSDLEAGKCQGTFGIQITNMDEATLWRVLEDLGSAHKTMNVEAVKN